MMRTDWLRGARPCVALQQIDNRRGTFLVALLAAVLGAGSARAQAVAGSLPPPTPQFDVTGFIQSATTDNTRCPLITDPLLWGGTVTVNGITMIVPCNTVIQMPANTVSWAMLFPQLGVSSEVGVAPVGTSTAGLNGLPGGPLAGTTGLALADANPLAPGSGPFPSFEIRAEGNIVAVPDPVTGAVSNQYVVGLIAPVTQQGANAGFGIINCIDYANSFIYVGGDPTQPCVLATGQPNGARLQINDPVGRWGIAHSPEPLFSGDFNNSTVTTSTGYPVCVPRVAPTSVGVGDGGDPQCPAGNRPVNGDPRFPVDAFIANGAPLRIFTMPAPPAPAFGIPGTPAQNCPQVVGGPLCIPAVAPVPPAPPAYPDARFQVPLMVGDFITYAGTLAKGDVTLAAPDYISVHTLNANLGIYTPPGTRPAYVSVETILLGTSGTPTNNVSIEATTRIFIVGFTTDPNALIDINAVDVDPCTGDETLRLLGTVDPLTQVVKGRFRFHVLGGQFMPPTREMIITSHDGTTPATLPFDPLQPAVEVGAANGFGSGQYRLPNFDFIFPENLTPGEPIVPNNFQDMPFLAQGSGPLLGNGSLVGQLTPWPGSLAPVAATCVTTPTGVGAAPIANAGPDIVVASGLPEALFGTVIQDPNGGVPTITWTQTAGPLASLTPNLIDPMQPSFSTVGIAPGSVLTFQLTVTDLFGTSTALTNVTVVDPATVDFIDPALASAKFKPPAVIPINANTGTIKGNRVNFRGRKGGILSVTAVDNITDPTIILTVMGFGQMSPNPAAVPPGLPSYVLKVTGAGDVPPVGPDGVTQQVTVHSSRGGEITIPIRVR
jgi:hypothetical protein